jgi:hypothetical protein
MDPMYCQTNKLAKFGSYLFVKELSLWQFQIDQQIAYLPTRISACSDVFNPDSHFPNKLEILRGEGRLKATKKTCQTKCVNWHEKKKMLNHFLLIIETTLPSSLLIPFAKNLFG